MRRAFILLVVWLSAMTATTRAATTPRTGLIDSLLGRAHMDPLRAADLLISARGGLAIREFPALDRQRANVIRARALQAAFDDNAPIETIARIAMGAIVTSAPAPTLKAITDAYASFRAGEPDGRQRLLQAALRVARAHHPPRATSCVPLEVAPEFWFDLEGCDSTYTQDAALIVDVGGNDTYLNNAGGTATPQVPAAALIDFAGSDTYRGWNGGGWLGDGFLLDLEGDDTYEGRGPQSNGGAAGGTGFLLDGNGNDVYNAPFIASNGGASLGGDGTLIDLADGMDRYTAGSSGGNGGATDAGRGHLIDGGGDDTYNIVYLSSYGSGANGGGNFLGSGFLFDNGGDDVYRSTYGGGNGGSYGIDSSGFLYDGAGDDDYFIDDGYGGNGGSSGGAGMLVDGGGNDHYWGTGGFEQTTWRAHNGMNGGAAASFLGSPCFGALIDASGDDIYEGGNNGINGGAQAGLASVAVAGALLDGHGNDRYLGNAGSVNGGAASVVIGNVHGSGLLLDDAGDDTYIADYSAVNGGGGVLAALVDRRGRDRYVEGGVESYDSTVLLKDGTGAQVDLAG